MWPSGDKKSVAFGGDENFTFLGKGVDFKGIVHFEGTVRIDGRLEGEIHTKGTLIVGDLAIIKGIISGNPTRAADRPPGTGGRRGACRVTREDARMFVGTRREEREEKCGTRENGTRVLMAGI